MNDQLKRILNLVRKTGDTMIVTDPNGEDVYVVMGLDAYESLKLGEISQKQAKPDISTQQLVETRGAEDWDWGVPAPAPELVGEATPELDLPEEPTVWDVMRSAGDQGDTWDLAKMSEDEMEDLEEQYRKYAQESTVAKTASVVAESVSEENPPNLEEKDEEFGEEQFYLEPIE